MRHQVSCKYCNERQSHQLHKHLLTSAQIRLEGLCARHHMFSSYEPELFPGLIYRMMKPKIVLLIFVSGKIVLTGAKVREEIYQAFELIYPVLSDFRKT